MSEQKPVSRQRLQQIAWKSQGKCITCGKPRGEGGAIYCPEHLKKHSALQLKYFRQKKALRLAKDSSSA